MVRLLTTNCLVHRVSDTRVGLVKIPKPWHSESRSSQLFRLSQVFPKPIPTFHHLHASHLIHCNLFNYRISMRRLCRFPSRHVSLARSCPKEPRLSLSTFKSARPAPGKAQSRFTGNYLACEASLLSASDTLSICPRFSSCSPKLHPRHDPRRPSRLRQSFIESLVRSESFLIPTGHRCRVEITVPTPINSFDACSSRIPRLRISRPRLRLAQQWWSNG